MVCFLTYINAPVRGSKEDEWDGDLDLRRASIIHFGRFGVVLPEGIQTLHGMSWKESEKRGLMAMPGSVGVAYRLMLTSCKEQNSCLALTSFPGVDVPQQLHSLLAK